MGSVLVISDRRKGTWRKTRVFSLARRKNMGTTHKSPSSYSKWGVEGTVRK